MSTAACPTDALVQPSKPRTAANRWTRRPSGGRVVGMGWRCADAGQLPRTGLRDGRRGVYPEPRDLTASLRGDKWVCVEKDRDRGVVHEEHVPGGI